MPAAEIPTAPHASQLRAAPVGDAVAWVVSHRGRRDVWVATAAAAGVRRARALTAGEPDDDREIGSLQWTPSADALVFTRRHRPAASRERAGRGLPDAEVWHAALAGGVPHKLIDGHSPALSPDGARLACIVAGQVWSVALRPEGGTPRWIGGGGVSRSLAWSPDGTRLAFVGEETGQTVIGLCDVADGIVRWLPGSGGASDDHPGWSPDGATLAFVRTPDRLTQKFSSRPTARPWSIWIADAASGASRPAWSAHAGDGSVFVPLPSQPQLAWVNDDALVFAWEGSGWLNLYLLTLSTGAALPLAPGEHEVFAAVADPLRNVVVCSSNAGDASRRHLWRIDLGSRAGQAISAGDSIEDLPVVLADGRVAAMQADGATPVHPVLITGSGVSALGDPGAGWPTGECIRPDNIAFVSPDGLRVHAQIFLPHRPAGRRLPAVVHFHGGPERQMLPAWHPDEVYHRQYGLNQTLARRGFAVLSVNYRGSSGHGLHFREPENLGAAGASEALDAIGAVLYLRSRPDIDTTRIAAWGHSYGGLMTVLALAKAPECYAAGVAMAPVADWTPAFVDAASHTLELARQSSPVSMLGGWCAPVLFIHAEDDEVVPPAQTHCIVDALRARGGVHVERMMIADERHDLLDHRSWQAVMRATLEFLDRWMGDS